MQNDNSVTNTIGYNHHEHDDNDNDEDDMAEVAAMMMMMMMIFLSCHKFHQFISQRQSIL